MLAINESKLEKVIFKEIHGRTGKTAVAEMLAALDLESGPIIIFYKLKESQNVDMKERPNKKVK